MAIYARLAATKKHKSQAKAAQSPMDYSQFYEEVKAGHIAEVVIEGRNLKAKTTDGKSITTYGPYSQGQAVAQKRAGIEGIYLGGWATSAKGSTRTAAHSGGAHRATAQKAGTQHVAHAGKSDHRKASSSSAHGGTPRD